MKINATSAQWFRTPELQLSELREISTRSRLDRLLVSRRTEPSGV
jgi:hypothetical protein